MKARPFQIAALLLVIVAIFPPVNWRRPYVGDQVNVGFKFIGALERDQTIRVDQWLVELAVAGGVGLLLIAAARKN